MTKIALVTGANRGLGLEISRQLAQQGIKVVIAARDRAKGQVAVKQLLQVGLDVEFQYLDVTDIESIKVVYSYLDQTYGKLDILINNAGVCLEGEQKPSEISLNVVRQTLETNFIGAIATTQTLLPLIYKSEAGRIVNMSSGRGSLTQHSDSKYHYAKTLAYNASNQCQ